MATYLVITCHPNRDTKHMETSTEQFITEVSATFQSYMSINWSTHSFALIGLKKFASSFS